ncbi:hypothetical protein Tco_1343540, partial [Tanacetum coccineum]
LAEVAFKDIEVVLNELLRRFYVMERVHAVIEEEWDSKAVDGFERKHQWEAMMSSSFEREDNDVLIKAATWRSFLLYCQNEVRKLLSKFHKDNRVVRFRHRKPHLAFVFTDRLVDPQQVLMVTVASVLRAIGYEIEPSSTIIYVAIITSTLGRDHDHKEENGVRSSDDGVDNESEKDDVEES